MINSPYYTSSSSSPMIRFIKRNTRVALALCLWALSFGVTAADEAPASGTFTTGSVVMFCTEPENTTITDAQFQKAFPQWMDTLQKLADEGTVVRAHHLNTLKGGIFIVIAGDTPEDAMNNAVLTSYQLSDIFIKATGLANYNSCEFHEIGPVVIMPTN